MTQRALCLTLLLLAACHRTTGAPGSTGSGSTGSASSGSTGSTGSTGSCTACLADSDCQGGGHCIQFGQDSYCLSGCASTPCSGTDTCRQLSDFQGNPQQVCVPASGSCANDTSCPGGCPAGSTCDPASRTCVGGSGSTGSSETCGSLVGPDVSAGCSCASGHTCSANNCYGGWWCDTSNNHCVAPPTACTSGSSGSTGTSSGSCQGLVGPTDASSACHCPSNHTSDCQPNGCYGGWWCDPVAGRCQAPPANCSSGGSTTGTSGTTGGTSGTTGAPWTGSVGAQGGSVSRLYFAAVGDARPPNKDQTSQYPTAIITKIFQGMAALNPQPQFVVSTGDYMFASPTGSEGAAQLDLYLQARAAYPGVLFASLGNHECTGYTASNCGSGNQDGITNNYTAFLQKLLGPINQTQPYYRVDVNDSAGQWTAKFITLAMNAWDSAQGTWLQQQLAQTTTYTFIIRHEPEAATTAPGVSPSDAIIAQYPYTLKIVGHTHEYQRAGTRQVIVGNGGAPISGSGTYGYALIEQTANGDIQVSEIDYSSNAPVSSFVVSK